MITLMIGRFYVIEYKTCKYQTRFYCNRQQDPVHNTVTAYSAGPTSARFRHYLTTAKLPKNLQSFEVAASNGLGGDPLSTRK